ncbi:MAG: hypothetical protein KBB64_10015 [Bacteroidia bacterium]|nr:hypothetical protein [Bacteroidia bacterium]
MKTLSKLLVVAGLFMMAFASCKKDDNSSSPSSSMVTQGQWKVTLFSENGVVETSKFSNYVFTFTSNGTVSAVRSGSTVNGSWSDGNDDSQKKLNMNFASPVDFTEISDDWHILQESSSKIELEDVSGGNGGTDLLTFEKI